MHAPTLHSSFENSATSSSRNSAIELFAAVLPFARSIFLSSLLWICLAFVLYGVYTLIVGH